MQKTIDQQRYIKCGGRIIMVAVAMVLLPIIFYSTTLACIKVYEVSIYAGKSQAEANNHEYDGEIMYIPVDSPAYFLAEIDDVCNPDFNDFVWDFDFDSDSIWDYNDLTYWLYCIPYPPNPWSYDTEGWYNPKVKVGLKGVPDSDAEDTCQVGVVTVTNVVWQTIPGNTPLAGGKIFPGKKTHNDVQTYRRKVFVKATLNMEPDEDDNIEVHFKCWDVDDPSADSAPIDEDDDDPDPNKHSIDNNGSFNFEDTGHSVDVLAERGLVHAIFLVSMRPGDNYRITATTSQKANDDLTHYKVETGNMPSSVKRTPILTTWRKLHLELDSMAAGQDNPVSNRNIDGTWNNTPHTGESGAEINGWNIHPDEGQYEGGTLIVSSVPFEIIDNIDDALDDTVYVIGNICPYEDQSASFTDDDICALPRKAYVSLMNSKFNPAYVEVVEEAGVYNDDATFIANLGPSDADRANAANPVSTRTTSESYWMVQILSCHQGGRSTDGDPDSVYHWHGPTSYKTGDPGVTVGRTSSTSETEDNICVIYLESIRDQAAQESFLVSVGLLSTAYSASEIEKTTVVHEIAHVFGCMHSDGGIMQLGAEDPNLYFTPVSIDKIRNLYHIGIP